MEYRCKYYNCKDVYIRSKIVKSDRNPSRPKIYLKEWCDHPESLHKAGVIGSTNVPCGGDTEKCVIPNVNLC